MWVRSGGEDKTFATPYTIKQVLLKVIGRLDFDFYNINSASKVIVLLKQRIEHAISHVIHGSIYAAVNGYLELTSIRVIKDMNLEVCKFWDWLILFIFEHVESLPS